MENIEKFNDILQSFKINASCVDYQHIDNYFYYDLKLLNKTKVKDITRFSDEISLNLKTPCKPSVKVLHDKGVVRLEFIDSSANVNINLFDLFTEEEIPKGELVCLLGKTVEGNKIWMNLENNPNLIVAGTTGSGKSTLLHNIIANILFYNKAKLYLIDPKNIEFSNYNNLNSNIDVYNTYDETIYVLDSLINLMENRYKLMRSGIKASSFPPVVLIIDEFSDLILQDTENNFYNKLLKLSQKSRAAKIHIILSTQRPSANIINGSIKANFPSRISCKVASHVDSKIILDSIGAENLLGKGDALIKDNFRHTERFQIAYTDSKQVSEYFKVL